MVRLNSKQEKVLSTLTGAKAAYDAAVKEAELRLKWEKETLKAPLRDMVKEALEAGIPARQVAVKGLGYADVGSLKQFTEERITIPNNYVAPTPPVKQKVQEIETELGLDTYDLWYVTDEYGTRWTFDRSNDKVRSLFQDELDAVPEDQREKIRAAIERDSDRPIRWE